MDISKLKKGLKEIVRQETDTFYNTDRLYFLNSILEKVIISCSVKEEKEIMELKEIVEFTINKPYCDEQ